MLLEASCGFEPSRRRPKARGPVAQLVEHLFCTQGVAGSIPVGSTTALPSGNAAIEALVAEPA